MAQTPSTEVALATAEIELAQAQRAQDVDAILAAQATVDELLRRQGGVERQIAAEKEAGL